MAQRKKKLELLEVLPEDDAETNMEGCHEACEDEKYSSIAECAYYKAESRGFESGHELDDWLAAESEIGIE